MMKKQAAVLFAFATMASGCGSSNGVTDSAAETVCRAWCDPGNACGMNFGSSPARCLEACIAQAVEPCGQHYHAKRQCELDLDCNDVFEDCATHDEDRAECNAERQAFCQACDPPLDPARYAECLETQQCPPGAGGTGGAGGTCPVDKVKCDGVCIDAIEPTLTSIQPAVFNVSCTASACHDADLPAMNLDLSSVPASEANLVDVDAEQVDGKRVAAGDSANSYLMNKLLGENIPPPYLRAPIGGDPLCAPKIDAIRMWIDDGAPVN